MHRLHVQYTFNTIRSITNIITKSLLLILRSPVVVGQALESAQLPHLLPQGRGSCVRLRRRHLQKRLRHEEEDLQQE